MKYRILLIISFIVICKDIKAQNIFQLARANDISGMSLWKKDINTKNIEGYTPLIIAVYNDNYNAAKWLLDHGALIDLPDNSGNTALMGAIFRGYYNIAKLLLMNKADVNRQNSNGATALTYASVFSKVPLIELLLENGADKSIKDNSGKTALQHALLQGNKDAILLLK